MEQGVNLPIWTYQKIIFKMYASRCFEASNEMKFIPKLGKAFNFNKCSGLAL